MTRLLQIFVDLTVRDDPGSKNAKELILACFYFSHSGETIAGELNQGVKTQLIPCNDVMICRVPRDLYPAIKANEAFSSNDNMKNRVVSWPTPCPEFRNVKVWAPSWILALRMLVCFGV